MAYSPIITGVAVIIAVKVVFNLCFNYFPVRFLARMQGVFYSIS